MTPTGPGINPRAIAWALLSQVIWLPLVAIDMHDRWLAHLRQITPPSGSAQLDRDIARSPALGLDKLLDATAPVKDLARNAITSTGVLLSTAGSGATSLLDRPLSRSIEELLPQNHGSASAAHPGSSNSQPPAARTAVSGSGSGENWLNNHFTRAQLLGGSVDLNDLHEGSMSPLAMVERAASLSSGDPMGPLPSMWRNPMRQALLQLPGGPRRIATARVIHVPSLSVSHSTEVPLAIQSDGSVDILQTPDNPAVIKEIDTWSRHQQRPAVGSVVPAVIHLHPLEPAPVLTPDSRPAAPDHAPQRRPSGAIDRFVQLRRQPGSGSSRGRTDGRSSAAVRCSAVSTRGRCSCGGSFGCTCSSGCITGPERGTCGGTDCSLIETTPQWWASRREPALLIDSAGSCTDRAGNRRRRCFGAYCVDDASIGDSVDGLTDRHFLFAVVAPALQKGPVLADTVPGRGQQGFEPCFDCCGFQQPQQLAGTVLNPLRSALLVGIATAAVVQCHRRAHRQIAHGQIHHPLPGKPQLQGHRLRQTIHQR